MGWVTVCYEAAVVKSRMLRDEGLTRKHCCQKSSRTNTVVNMSSCTMSCAIYIRRADCIFPDQHPLFFNVSISNRCRLGITEQEHALDEAQVKRHSASTTRYPGSLDVQQAICTKGTSRHATNQKEEEACISRYWKRHLECALQSASVPQKAAIYFCVLWGTISENAGSRRATDSRLLLWIRTVCRRDRRECSEIGPIPQHNYSS